jgi:short-subunit dehydrogenase
MISLKGKTVLIAGATGGMGSELARALAREEAALVLIDKDEARLAEFREELQQSSQVAARILAADLGKPLDAETLLALSDVARDTDILVYAAGYILPAPVEQVSDADFEIQFQVNFGSAFRLVRLLIPKLKEKKGQVVMINSSIINYPKSDLSVYAASKHALAGFTESLRQELNPYGVRVISLVPGKTATKMQDDLARDTGISNHPERMIQPADIAATVIHALKLPTTAELTDLYIRPMQK